MKEKLQRFERCQNCNKAVPEKTLSWVEVEKRTIHLVHGEEETEHKERWCADCIQRAKEAK